MTGKIRALVLTGFGLNCDLETAHAFELAGAEADRVHINALIDGSARLDDYQILALGGGFSWGDDHGAGVLQAVRLRTNIGDQMRAFVERQRLVIGICNGFQTLVNLGLLPGFDGDYQSRSVALTFNDCGNFRDDWVTLKADTQSPCVFTEGLDILDLPIRHGEGKFFAAPEVIAQLERNHQIVVRYAKPDGAAAAGTFPYNPNGSPDGITALSSDDGRATILMPHPERVFRTITHSWHPSGWGEDSPWMQLFYNARRWVG